MAEHYMMAASFHLIFKLKIKEEIPTGIAVQLLCAMNKHFIMERTDGGNLLIKLFEFFSFILQHPYRWD